jgi:hypothetical protein
MKNAFKVLVTVCLAASLASFRIPLNNHGCFAVPNLERPSGKVVGHYLCDTVLDPIDHHKWRNLRQHRAP